MKFKVVYDNLVTDDLIEEVFECATIEGAENIAWIHSGRSGLSQGNYQLFIEIDGTFIDAIDFIDKGE